MSVYLALHTAASPNIGDIAEFGRRALELGCDPTQPLAVMRAEGGALTVVVPWPAHTEQKGEGDG